MWCAYHCAQPGASSACQPVNYTIRYWRSSMLHHYWLIGADVIASLLYCNLLTNGITNIEARPASSIFYHHCPVDEANL